MPQERLNVDQVAPLDVLLFRVVHQDTIVDVDLEYRCQFVQILYATDFKSRLGSFCGLNLLSCPVAKVLIKNSAVPVHPHAFQLLHVIHAVPPHHVRPKAVVNLVGVEVLNKFLDMGTKVEKITLEFRVVSHWQRGFALEEEGLVQVKCHQDVLELFHQHRLYYYCGK